ncbi:hypothetical protein, partial [Escherichia coli]|uniref:hypothetical protein n=1 Tax=Escherichia coli TaxID=562 RepID=UPI001101B8DB
HEAKRAGRMRPGRRSLGDRHHPASRFQACELHGGDMLREGNAPPVLQNRLFRCPTDHPGWP